jgi:hypothetical protein
MKISRFEPLNLLTTGTSDLAHDSRTILPLLGERAGVRAGFSTNISLLRFMGRRSVINVSAYL